MDECLQAAVVGHPVRHSLSPVIFGFLARQLKKRLVYRAIDIVPEDVCASLKLCSQVSFVGFNVTIPLKEEVIPYLSSLSSEAKAVGAVNVIHFDGCSTVGYNTDVMGIMKTLSKNNVQVKGKSVVVFGAGGAARAVAYAVGKEGAYRVWIRNRTFAKGEKLCASLQDQLPNLEFVAARSIRQIRDEICLYVNATPLGMEGFPLESRLPKTVPSDSAAFDLVYKPRLTPFIQSARRQGIKAIGGLDLLIWQAIGTWEIWFGPVSDRSEICSSLKRLLVGELARESERSVAV